MVRGRYSSSEPTSGTIDGVASTQMPRASGPSSALVVFLDPDRARGVKSQGLLRYAPDDILRQTSLGIPPDRNEIFA